MCMLGMYIHVFAYICERVAVNGCLGGTVYDPENATHTMVCGDVQPYEVACV